MLPLFVHTDCFFYFYVFRSIHSLMLICQHLNNIKGKTQYVQYVH